MSLLGCGSGQNVLCFSAQSSQTRYCWLEKHNNCHISNYSFCDTVTWIVNEAVIWRSLTVPDALWAVVQSHDGPESLWSTHCARYSTDRENTVNYYNLSFSFFCSFLSFFLHVFQMRCVDGLHSKPSKIQYSCSKKQILIIHKPTWLCSPARKSQRRIPTRHSENIIQISDPF